MSTEFPNHLTTLLDDVAASISPRSDFASAHAGAAEVPLTRAGSGGRPPFRTGLAIAAAIVLVCAGGVLAYQRANDAPDTVSTASDVTAAPTPGVDDTAPDATGTDGAVDDPVDDQGPGDGGGILAAPAVDATGPDSDVTEHDTATRSAEVASVDFEREIPVVTVRGEAPDGVAVRVFSVAGATDVVAEDGVWEAVVELVALDRAPDGRLLITVTFDDGTSPVVLYVERPATEQPPEEPATDQTADQPAEEPAPEPPAEEPAPVVIAFEANVGVPKWDYEPPKVGLAGRAQPETTVHAASEFGENTVTANAGGYWEMWLQMWEIAPGQTAHIRVTSTASSSVYEWALQRPPAEPAPEPVAFTAADVEGVDTGDPIWHRFSGTAQPGSGVLATSDYGAADVAVGESGEWTLKLWMNDVPAGSRFKVRVTNTAAEAAYDFWIETPPAEPAPDVAFTASAAFTTCDSTPPYNEYWGTAQPGTVVTITSPYGGAERVAGPDGGWDARIEFPEAPIGEPFVVKVKSVATGEVQEFGFTRLAAA